MRTFKPWMLLAVLALAVVWWSQLPHRAGTVVPAPAPGLGSAADGTSSPDTVSEETLPPEARATLQLIKQGGPFPHRQDGVVFGNYEGLLPSQPRGFYHEYTVDTPGADNRGTRRIITGGNPPQVYYYTDDHYHSFRRFQVDS